MELSKRATKYIQSNEMAQRLLKQYIPDEPMLIGIKDLPDKGSQVGPYMLRADNNGMSLEGGIPILYEGPDALKAKGVMKKLLRFKVVDKCPQLGISSATLYSLSNEIEANKISSELAPVTFKPDTKKRKRLQELLD